MTGQDKNWKGGVVLIRLESHPSLYNGLTNGLMYLLSRLHVTN